MRTNTNFISNFPQGNMIDSLKLAQYNSSQPQANPRKQYTRYASNTNQQQYDNPTQHQKSSTKYQIQQIKNIKTQQSQLSNIDAGIIKLKGNQVQILNELRSQFDKIRNMPSNTTQKLQQKMCSSSQQNNSHPGNIIRNDSSSQISSQKIKQKNNINGRQEKLWNVQKNQYQFMLANCQHKIQQLLHAQMEYKKIIYQLKSNNNLPKPSTPTTPKPQNDITVIQKQFKQEKQKNYLLTNQLEKIKSTSKSLTEKITKYQSQNNYRYKDQSKLADQKRKLQQYLRLQKDRYMNSQIQKRKYQMQNQILQREKQQQIVRVQRQLQSQNQTHQLNIKNTIKKYQDQIQVKDRRYRLLLREFQQLKKDYAITKQQAQKPSINQQLMQTFKRLLQDKKNTQNQQFTKTINNLMDKLQQKQPAYDQDVESPKMLLQQIKLLKAEIQHLRNSTNDAFDLQPMKKMYQAQIASLKDTIAVLERKVKTISQQQQQSQAYQPPPQTFQPQYSQMDKIQTGQLQKKIAQLQFNYKKSMSNSDDAQSLLYNQRKKLQTLQQQLRNQRHKRYQSQFQLTKLQKQLQFKLTISSNQKQSILKQKQSQLDRSNSNIIYWKQQFNNMKNFYQQKLTQKNRLLQQSSHTMQIISIKNNYDTNLDQAKLQYQKQINALAQKLTNHNANSLDYDSISKKYTQLQSAYYDLQNSLIKAKKINQAVDHLWYVKQTQYGNVNQILRQIYPGHHPLNQPYANQPTGVPQSRIQQSSLRRTNIIKPPTPNNPPNRNTTTYNSNYKDPIPNQQPFFGSRNANSIQPQRTSTNNYNTNYAYNNANTNGNNNGNNYGNNNGNNYGNNYGNNSGGQNNNYQDNQKTGDQQEGQQEPYDDGWNNNYNYNNTSGRAY